MDRLEECLRRDHPETVLVRINVWREESQADLHYEIVKTILGQPVLLRRYLASYPKALAFAPMLHLVSRLLPDGMTVGLHFQKAAVDTRFSVPLRWQCALERAAEAWCRHGMRIVVVMDEVDRAESPIAQAAITLCRRGLELPGVTVILPYVDEQIRHKVFNPLLAYSPDLLSSMHAAIANYTEPATPVALEDFVSETDVARFVRSAREGSGGEEAKNGKPKTSRQEADDRAGPRAQGMSAVLREKLHLALTAKYLGTSVLSRWSLYRTFRDKYLGYSLDLPQFGPDDFPPMLVQFPSLARFRQPGGPLAGIGSDEDFRKRITKAIRGLIANQRLRGSPAIRALEGYVVSELEYSAGPTKPPPAPPPEPEPREMVVTRLVLAWFAAARMY
jgi:hypothetical protein